MKATCGIFLFALCLAPVAAHGQTAASQEPKVTVGVTDSLAPQDWDLRLPVSVTIAEGTAVGRLTFRLVYSTNVLKFEELELTGGLAGGTFEATAEAVVPPPSDESSAVLISISAAEGETAALPGGVVLNAIFRTSNLVEPGDWPVKVEGVQAWSAGASPAALAAAAGPDAKVTVAPAGLPIFACYFYMH